MQEYYHYKIFKRCSDPDGWHGFFNLENPHNPKDKNLVEITLSLDFEPVDEPIIVIDVSGADDFYLMKRFLDVQEAQKEFMFLCFEESISMEKLVKMKYDYDI